MSMEKQGVIKEGVTPPENANEPDCGCKPSESPIDKLADDHTTSRLIQKMRTRRAGPQPINSTC